MSETSLALIMGAQAVLLALISRVRWRCYQDDEGACRMVSGCTEFSLSENHSEVVTEEHELSNGARVLVVSTKTEYI